MSLINDALKQARQNPPSDNHPPTHSPMLPLQPVAPDPVPVADWLIPAIIIFLIVAAVFCVGWAMANRAISPKPVLPVTIAASVPQPAAPAPAVVIAAPEPPAVVVEAVPLPVLQGIFYSPTAPSAIVDGKTVRPGDKIKQYRVKEITKFTVTVVDAEGKAIKLIMGN